MYQKRKELNRENNTLDKQIFAENQGVFTDMICYLRGSSLSAYDQERVRRDLTEMVLDAQERGDTLSDVIGGDYKAFCDEIIASLPHKSAGRRAAEYGGIVCLAAAVLGSIKILLSPSFLTWLPDFLTGRAAAPPYLAFFSGRCIAVRCHTHRFGAGCGADRSKRVRCGKGQGRKSCLYRSGAGSGCKPVPVAAVAGGNRAASRAAASCLCRCCCAVSSVSAVGCCGERAIIGLPFTFWADGLSFWLIYRSLNVSAVIRSRLIDCGT